ncbi:unnamed protein product [Trifolium pratense]|uniref:Uncharacterized protein n=1 Tax=Trifolium pratense TaxID=57577 RepID=A0ACB0LP26_TRIPR|nr:unnamed protein product [Trifolium pratense]
MDLGVFMARVSLLLIVKVFAGASKELYSAYLESIFRPFLASLLSVVSICLTRLAPPLTATRFPNCVKKLQSHAMSNS